MLFLWLKSEKRWGKNINSCSVGGQSPPHLALPRDMESSALIENQHTQAGGTPQSYEMNIFLIFLGQILKKTIMTLQASRLKLIRLNQTCIS